MVWAIPRSLATTYGITFVFFSYGYLDVSVPHVCLPYGMTGLQPAGLPHSEITGSIVICTSPALIAAYHVLLRLREPRHPPSALAYFLFPCTYIAIRHVSDWYIFKACSFFVTLLLCCPSCQRSSFQRLVVVERIKNHRFFILLLWRITDSNRWPSACKADALASWANPPYFRS